MFIDVWILGITKSFKAFRNGVTNFTIDALEGSKYASVCTSDILNRGFYKYLMDFIDWSVGL